MTGAITPQPGWYPDPDGAPVQRFWDGSQWTEPNPTSAAANIAASTARPPAAGSDKRVLWIAAGILGVVVVAVSAFTLGANNPRSGDTAGATISAARTAPTTTQLSAEERKNIAYLNELQYFDVPVENGNPLFGRMKLTLVGYEVCYDLGQPGATVMTAARPLINQGYDARAAGHITAVAVDVLCPDKKP